MGNKTDNMKYEKTLKELQERMEEIAGEWNGKEPGVQEDKARIASDAIRNIIQLNALLLELEEIES